MTERELQAIRERLAYVPGRAATVELAAWDASRRADIRALLRELESRPAAGDPVRPIEAAQR